MSDSSTCAAAVVLNVSATAGGNRYDLYPGNSEAAQCQLMTSTVFSGPSSDLDVVALLRSEGGRSMPSPSSSLHLVLSFQNTTVVRATLNNISIDCGSVNVTRQSVSDSGIGYPIRLMLGLSRASFELCLSRNDSLLLLNCTDSGPVLAAAPVVSQAAASTVKSAIAGSVAVAAAGGPASAGDVQATAILALSNCGKRYVGVSPGEYTLVTPVALWDSAVGALTGNAVAFAAVVLVHLVVARAVHKSGRSKTITETCALVRFPAISVMFGASLHQSTLFSSLRILQNFDSGGVAPLVTLVGVFAFLSCVALPAGLVFAATRIKRRFVRYEFERMPTSFVWRVVYSVALPFGTTLPSEMRLISSSLVTAYRHPSPFCVLIPFVSSFAVNLAAVAPLSACSFAMSLSAVVHVALIVAIVWYQVYSSRLGSILSCAGLLLLAVFQIVVAANRHDASTPILLIQSMLSLIRSVVSFGISQLETFIRSRDGTIMTAVMWSVGGANTWIPKWFNNKDLKDDLDEGESGQSMMVIEKHDEEEDDPFALRDGDPSPVPIPLIIQSDEDEVERESASILLRGNNASSPLADETMQPQPAEPSSTFPADAETCDDPFGLELEPAAGVVDVQDAAPSSSFLLGVDLSDGEITTSDDDSDVDDANLPPEELARLRTQRRLKRDIESFLTQKGRYQ